MHLFVIISNHQCMVMNHLKIKINWVNFYVVKMQVGNSSGKIGTRLGKRERRDYIQKYFIV
jgi:hypothetical protein